MIYAAETGLLIGGTVGIAAGQLVVILGVLGALTCAWLSSMIGSSVPSQRIKRFEAARAQGQILLMVDVPSARAKAIEALLQTSHPEARFEGEDPDTPVLP